MSFEGKVVLITGASSGMGRATALHFAKEKAKIILIGRNKETLAEATNICTNTSGFTALAIQADVSKDKDVERIVENTTKTFGRLDVLINNAGVFIHDDIFTTTTETFDTHINTNLRSVFNLTRLFVPLLIESQGSIVNISGVETVKYIEGLLTVNLSKVSVEQFTKYVAKELAPKKVRANCLVLGYVTGTKIIERANMNVEDFEKDFINSVPLGEFIKPEDVAVLVAFLASDKSKHITGQNIVMDGGFTTY